MEMVALSENPKKVGVQDIDRTYLEVSAVVGSGTWGLQTVACSQ